MGAEVSSGGKFLVAGVTCVWPILGIDLQVKLWDH